VTYDLKPIRAPRLAGNALHAFTWLLENGAARSLLAPKLLEDAGIGAFRRRHLEEAPMPLPEIQPERWAAAGVPAGGGSEGAGRSRGSVTGSITASAPSPLHALAAVSPAASAPPDGSFHFETIAEFGTAYRDGGAEPQQVAERLLAAVDASERQSPAMRILVACDREDVMRQAAGSSARWKSGRPLGPLDGVPIAIKDELDQVPYPTRVGTAFLDRRPSEDATVVARLRAQGALLFGKANMHEVGIGVTGLNPHHGTPRNPYDPLHHTGGSSSGPGAAVAAGLGPVAMGADGGGSIRTPASFCGVVGLKATFGRISEHGAAPLCWTVAHVGPLAATARDCALAFAAVAGADPRDPGSQGRPPLRLDRALDPDLRGLRIGVYRPWFEDADEGVVAACRSALSALQDAGAILREVELPDLELSRVAHLITIVSEMATSTAGTYEEHRADHGLDVRVNLALARTLTSADYVRAQQARARATAAWRAALSDCDAILSPTNGCTAPRIAADALKKGESNLPLLGKIIRFVFPANLVGVPAISIPAGADASGLPVGLQAMGRPWDEALLLRLAQAVEDRIARPAPKVHWRLLGASH
jgi:Asp-tRNA(Asn)/Glu-tRNA(Gln) amidotransferase A subunit family amidase